MALENVLNGSVESFWTKPLFIFRLFESISEESKTMGQNQNLMLFPNMSSEIICQILFDSSKGIFERLDKIVWTERLD